MTSSSPLILRPSLNSVSSLCGAMSSCRKRLLSEADEQGTQRKRGGISPVVKRRQMRWSLEGGGGSLA